jgi:hypothetical protein
MSNRLDNTREVVFEKDFNPSGKKVLYKAGEKQYIHKDVAAKLQAKKVKIEVKEFDSKGEIAKAKLALEKSKKAE